MDQITAFRVFYAMGNQPHLSTPRTRRRGSNPSQTTQMSRSTAAGPPRAPSPCRRTPQAALPDAAQVFLIERRVTDRTGKTLSRFAVPGLTSPTADHATPAEPAAPGIGTASSGGALWAYLGALAVAGAGSGLLDVAPSAMLGDLLSAQARQGGILVAFFQMAGDAGTATGPVVARLLVDSASYPAAFGQDGGVLAAAAQLALPPRNATKTGIPPIAAGIG